MTLPVLFQVVIVGYVDDSPCFIPGGPAETIQNRRKRRVNRSLFKHLMAAKKRGDGVAINLLLSSYGN